MRFWRVASVLGLAFAGACGGGDGGSSTSTSASPTTTGATTSSQAAATSTTARGTTSVLARPSASEPGAAALAAGTYPVYLTGVDAARRTITVDVVEVLDPHSAAAATVCPEVAGGGIDGYCIRNANPRLRTLAVASTASLKVLSGSNLSDVDIAGLAAARHPQREASFYEITVAGGKATAVKELYRP